jgi:hypothetical protein
VRKIIAPTESYIFEKAGSAPDVQKIPKPDEHHQRIMRCMPSKNLCGRNASLCACSSAAFHIYIYYMIHNSNCTGWIRGPRVAAAATAHTVCMPCVCRVSELAVPLSLCAGVSGNNGSARRAQRESSAHLPSPSIHPSVRPQAATQTERPWPMAHTTLFVRAVYFSSTQ